MSSQFQDNKISCNARLVALLSEIPPHRRGAALQSAVSFLPSRALKESIAVGPLRAAFAQCWEEQFGEAVPIGTLRALLVPPIPIGTVIQFSKLTFAYTVPEISSAVGELFEHLDGRLRAFRAPSQLPLFDPRAEVSDRPPDGPVLGGQVVESLSELVDRGCNVSPGPYLELYGREELPHSAWTVYGNQVEGRLF